MIDRPTWYPYDQTMIDVPPHVKIMAVTKTVPVERILPVLAEQHITLIGESRWQEAKEKLPHLPPSIEKHFIGHLQTNKVKEVVAAFDAIESIDSEKILTAVAQAAATQGKQVTIFLQVNVSNDPDKYGFKVEQIEQAVQQARTLSAVQLIGLMTITARESTEAVRQDYRRMKQLQQRWQLPELSMGMSQDWSIAVEEGATIIRLGRALFGDRPQP